MRLARRRFLTSLAAVTAAIQFPLPTGKAVAQASPSAWPIAIFEKVFEGLTYDELADAVQATGADGIEATIRPGGHIEPEAAADEVPKMAAALAERGRRIIIAATDIRSVEEPHTEALLKTLHRAGIRHYRMGHYYLALDRSPLEQVREYAVQVRDLAALNKQLGMQGLYQNHSGGNARRGYLGALGWDAALLLEGIEPSAMGLAFDTRHLRKDTGSSWQTAVAVCKPHIRSIYVKDGIWRGERGDEYADVPLDTGFVNREVFDTMRAGLPPMPLCIHMEWLGYRVFEKPEIPAAIEAHQRDIATLKNWLAADTSVRSGE